MTGSEAISLEEGRAGCGPWFLSHGPFCHIVLPVLQQLSEAEG